MTAFSPPPSTSGLPSSRKWLCAAYTGIAIASLVATWSQNLAYRGDAANFVSSFLTDTKANPAARSVTVDILLLTVSVAILMVIEARKHGVRFVWLYILGSAVTAVSVMVPLFLIARELKLSTTDRPALKATDTVALGVLAVATGALVVWVDVL